MLTRLEVSLHAPKAIGRSWTQIHRVYSRNPSLAFRTGFHQTTRCSQLEELSEQKHPIISSSPEGINSLSNKEARNTSEKTALPFRTCYTHKRNSKELFIPLLKRNGKSVFTDAIRLRDSCTCSKCVDPSTKQRKFRTSDIPSNILTRSLSQSKDGGLTTRWSNDVPGFDETHISTFSKPQILDISTNAYHRINSSGPSPIVTWDKETFDKSQHWISYQDYIKDDEKFRHFMLSLSQYGLVFLKDVPEEIESVANIGTRMGPLRNSFYGSTWDVRNVPQAKNVAYTNSFLDFHMDLLYMADPPGYQLLHCMKNSLPGGESLFSDSFLAANSLRDKDENAFEILHKFPVRFGYSNDNHLYEDIKTTFESHDTTGGHLINVNYSPPFQITSPRTSFKPDTSFLAFVEALNKFAKELEKPENVFELKLKPGECVIFKNRRIVHARRAFGSSEATEATDSNETDSSATKADRWLRGAYVDTDAVLSKFDILRNQNRAEWDESIISMKSLAVPKNAQSDQ